jgi:hypothetical protein
MRWDLYRRGVCMHIERVQGNGFSYLQALVRYPTVPMVEPWWKSYRRRMAAAAGLGDLTSAYRLCVRADGGIDRLFSAVVDPGKEQRVRRFFGAMSFLEGFDEDSVELPNDVSEFESWASDLPRLRCRIVPPPLRAGNIWLACDFRVAAHLDALVREAQSFGYAFGYQAHFLPFMPDIERNRRAGRNLIALQAAKGVPRDVLDDQKRQADRLPSATLLVEEIVATDQIDAAEWLTAALARLFKATPTRMRVTPPTFDLADGDDEFKMMMHSGMLYGEWTDDDLLCSQADDEGFRSRVLSYHPAIDAVPPDRRGTKRRVTDPDPPVAPSVRISEDAGHIFVSYRRLDWPRVGPIVERLAGQDLPIWYDRGIDAGEEWDAVLERKIDEAGMMLVFLSQAAADSRYCRREIRLADAIKKPLLVVVLEQANLPYGIQFLRLLQQISAQDHEFQSLLDRAIRRQLAASASARS